MDAFSTNVIQKNILYVMIRMFLETKSLFWDTKDTKSLF